ncbi:hypothetical protein CHUAL_005731 [Chamberlinius hualienensis]
MRLDMEVGHSVAADGQLPATFSDKIIVIENGPKRECFYSSRVEYLAEQNFKESVLIKPSLVPVRFRTTVIVDHCNLVDDGGEDDDIALKENGNFQQVVDDFNDAFNKFTESNDQFEDVKDEVDEMVHFDAPLRYYEEIYLLPKMMAKQFGSTVYSYPKETKKTYETVFNYCTNSKDKIYVTGLTYHSGVNSVDLGTSSKYLSNKQKLIIDGNVIPTSNGNGAVEVSNEKINGDSIETDDGQLFISTKELTIIKGIAVTDV